MGYVKKIAMVIFMQKDLAAAVAFYAKLGIPVVFELKNRWAELRVGDVQIGLCPTESELSDFRTGVVFEVEDVRGAYQALKDEVTFLSEPVEAVHGVMVSLKDPGNNIIDLYQPTPEKVRALAEKIKQEEGCCKGNEHNECADDEDQNTCC